MSSLTSTIAVMQSAQTYLYQYGCPVLMLIGTVSCILNLIVFTQQTLRKNACSIYFIAYNLVNLLYIYSSLLSSTMGGGYNSDLSSQNLVLCRLRLYVTIVLNVLSPFYLILASIDRILVTSRNALTRQRSTRRFAYICIASGTLFWALFHSPILIAATIIQLAPNYFLCYFEQSVYFTFISYYQIIIELLAVLLMIICGLWAIKNIRSIRHVGVAPILSVSRTVVEGGAHSTSSKDRQLILMLLIDISIYTPFSLVFGTFLTYEQVTPNYTKTDEQIQMENIIRNLCLLSMGVPFCTSCYTNLIVSKTFRKEVKKALSWQ